MNEYWGGYIQMNDLLSKIGEIIKIVQYIEHNLALLIRYQKVLKLFEDKDSVPNDLFYETDQEAEEIQDKLSNMTLGRVINYVKKYRFLNNQELNNLENILQKRNDLIHHYFKDKDFEKHSNNYGFIDNQTRYLTNFLNSAGNFNYYLCTLIEEKEDEYNAIE